MRENEANMKKANNQIRTKAVEGRMWRRRPLGSAPVVDSLRVFHSKAWLQRERLILKYPAWKLAKMGKIDLSTVPRTPCRADGVSAILDTSTTSSTWGWDVELKLLLFSINNGNVTHSVWDLNQLAVDQIYTRGLATNNAGGSMHVTKERG